MKRYEWNDGLIEAQSVGIINDTELLVALKLSHAITWHTSGKQSELRWANELAASVVGIKRATFYRALKGLKSAGYLTSIKGNLVPVLPESQIETRTAFEARREDLKSQIETTESQIETSKSQIDNPYSVDTYPVDLSPVKTTPPAGLVHDLIGEEVSIQPIPHLVVVENEAKSQIETLGEVVEPVWDTPSKERVTKRDESTFKNRWHVENKELRDAAW